MLPRLFGTVTRLLPERLAPRLILALTLLVSGVTGTSAWMNARSQRDQLHREMVLRIDQLSRGVVSATWQMMLADKRAAAYEVMEAMGADEEIRRIRIFNKAGQVTFSTDGHLGQVDTDAEACSMCHSAQEPLPRVDTSSRARIYLDPNGDRLMGMVTPIYNATACSEAPCHAHPPSHRVLGVLDVSVPLARVDQEVRNIEIRTLMWTLVEVALMAALIGVLTRQLVARPIHRLIRGAKAITAMDLDGSLDVRAVGEIGELAASLDVMRTQLRSALVDLSEFATMLEEKVQERGRQLDDAQLKLIQSDRLASLGQLAACVVHEINNPVAGVLNLSMLMERVLEDDRLPPDAAGELRRYSAAITEQTTRIGRIVSDLLSFARVKAPISGACDLNEVVERTVALVKHKVELAEVELDLRLAAKPPGVECDANQMQQVVLNLLMNAVEASEPGQTVQVRTGTKGPLGFLEVRDRGCGMAPVVAKRVFDPFFSTKEQGHGVGLGLSVVHGIIDAHAGTIDLQTSPGRGATFTVRLPLAARRDEEQSA